MIDKTFDRKSTTANVLYLIEWMKVEKGCMKMRWKVMPQYTLNRFLIKERMFE